MAAGRGDNQRPALYDPRLKAFRFLVSALLGLSFFALPIPVGDRLSVPFDVVLPENIAGRLPRRPDPRLEHPRKHPAVGTAALLLARETPLFTFPGAPLVPLLELLGVPDAEVVGPAALVGITEMYIPALLARDAAAPARFFVCTLSISQLIFFSAVGPMILDMFREVPVRARELVALFLLRTAILIPLLALVTAGFRWAGLFD